MTPLKQESISSKLLRIRRNVKELEQLGKLPYKAYVQNILHTSTAERLLQVSIEAMLDIGSHIVAEESLGEPLEYRDVFLLLIKGKILSKEKETAFINLAGLRNRIVHVYEDIDHKQIYRFLKHELGDIEYFVTAVMRYLKKQK
ncbi:MAG: hypothetical protein A3C46_08265 [Deltaproteobacteria bacterium RIFCSPHIGHO2_02_FULL_44_16]|nr:MAG: hypothetical protein A3C46_08265 [Deltaproteobacteria bacterium RIFCSPHIGHO2_02_FULL_44_16]